MSSCSPYVGTLTDILDRSTSKLPWLADLTLTRSSTPPTLTRRISSTPPMGSVRMEGRLSPIATSPVSVALKEEYLRDPALDLRPPKGSVSDSSSAS